VDLLYSAPRERCGGFLRQQQIRNFHLMTQLPGVKESAPYPTEEGNSIMEIRALSRTHVI